MFRKIAWILLAISVVSMIGEFLRLELPTVRWPFNTSREMDRLHWTFFEGEWVFPWFGWLLVGLMLLSGIALLFKYPKGAVISPLTARRIARFKDIRRGYISLWIVGILACIAGCDHLLVGNKPVVMKYDGEWYFPALVRANYEGAKFGETGEAGVSPADYRDLKEKFAEKGGENWMMMPLIPYNPTQDTVKIPVVELETRSDELVYRKGSAKPYDGLAATLYDKDNANRFHIRYRYRKGQKDGPAEGRNEKNKRVYAVDYVGGKIKEGSEKWSGNGSLDDFLKLGTVPLSEVLNFPARPAFSTGHWLGTNSSGNDLLAYLYGGLQVNFKAALFYIPAVYFLGITIGLLMGFFGGSFDLCVQRLIEVFSNIPFLFIIIIVSSAVPEKDKGLGIILLILVAFGWMGMTYLMRTAALKEKARDYVAASRVTGASTSRIIFKHILPNTVAILVTLVPFSISGLVMALTSLDYLGFGLPSKYATWGKLLRDGLDNLSSPWLVTSAFLCLVTLLILITFIGEAVREAFDPKKHTFYE